MPIRLLLEDEAKLGLKKDREDAATMLVARAIIDAAKRGERDPKRLCEAAIEAPPPIAVLTQASRKEDSRRVALAPATTGQCAFQAAREGTRDGGPSSLISRETSHVGNAAHRIRGGVPRKSEASLYNQEIQPWQNNSSQNFAFKTTRPLSRLTPTSVSVRSSMVAL